MLRRRLHHGHRPNATETPPECPPLDHRTTLGKEAGGARTSSATSAASCRPHKCWTRSRSGAPLRRCRSKRPGRRRKADRSR